MTILAILQSIVIKIYGVNLIILRVNSQVTCKDKGKVGEFDFLFFFLTSSQATKNPFYLHVGMDILQSLEKNTKVK